MKNRAKVSLEKTVNELQGDNAMSLDELKQLFHEYSGSTHPQFIEKESFLQLLSKRLNEHNSSVLSKYFSVLDSNGDSKISFMEFVCASSLLLTGSPEEKCKYIFDLCDTNKDNRISKEELYSLLSHMDQAPRILMEIAQEYGIEFEQQGSSEANEQGENNNTSEDGLRSIVDGFFEIYASGKDSLDAEQFSQLIKKNPKLLMLLSSKR